MVVGGRPQEPQSTFAVRSLAACAQMELFKARDESRQKGARRRHGSWSACTCCSGFSRSFSKSASEGATPAWLGSSSIVVAFLTRAGTFARLAEAVRRCFSRGRAEDADSRDYTCRAVTVLAGECSPNNYTQKQISDDLPHISSPLAGDVESQITMICRATKTSNEW